jgi:hypothetical protein
MKKQFEENDKKHPSRKKNFFSQLLASHKKTFFRVFTCQHPGAKSILNVI